MSEQVTVKNPAWSLYNFMEIRMTPYFIAPFLSRLSYRASLSRLMLSESRDRSLFVDHTRITVRGGIGGRGAMSFRREKFVPLGGPDGGNGGKGGDVLLIADAQKKSLLDLTYSPHFYAEEGEPGMGSNKSGHSGKDLLVYVPAGTLVYREGKLLADLRGPGRRIWRPKAAAAAAATPPLRPSASTAPQISEKGEPGESFELDLELKLLADVGLVGCPNAGQIQPPGASHQRPSQNRRLSLYHLKPQPRRRRVARDFDRHGGHPGID